VASIKKVVALVADIATASAEQATGIDQVNKALTQVDQLTQQNSALVEENAATAKTLEQQATVMNDRVGAFRLNPIAAPAQSAQSARPAPLPRAAETARPKPAAAKVAAAPRKVANGSGGRMTLAAAADSASDWKEF
jgi:ABC-type transporter Mla subunit MlaD